MPKTSYIDAVRVKKPCTEEWEQMTGTDKLRFCSHCTRHVNNISEMTRREARRLVRASNGNLCIRYIEDPATRRPRFAEQLVRIQRRSPRLAAGVMSASLSLAAITYGQENGPPPVRVPEIERHNDEKAATESVAVLPRRPRIMGTIVDPMGAVIPGTTVTLFNVGKNLTRTTTSGNAGDYVFENVEPGNYWIESESPGFAKNIREITVRESFDSEAEVAMEIGTMTVDVVIKMEVGMVMGGMMAFVIEYKSPLAKAVSDNDIEKVRELLAAGEDVNGREKENNGNTPLFIAVDRGFDEIVRLLIDHGADVNIRNDDEQTPLMQIDSDSTVEVTRMLLDAGAHVNAVDDEGNTPLILASRYADVEVVEILIQASADVNAANKDGQTALMNAADDDDIKMVKLLLNAGAYVNARNKEGENAWDHTGDAEVEKLLEDHGSETKRPDDEVDGINIVGP